MTRRLAVRLFAAMVVVVAAAASVRAQSVVVQLAAEATAPRVGEPFVLEVQARWPLGEPPLELEPKQLAPLFVDELQRQATPTSVTWRATVRSYDAGELVLAPVALQFPAAGGARAVASAPLVLRVGSALPTPPGELEWPGDVRELPRARGLVWWLLAGGVALAAGLWWRRQRIAVAPPTASAVATGPAVDVAARLQALAVPDDPSLCLRFCLDVKALLREHVHARHGVAADVATSEELCQLPRVGAGLQPCLQVVDRVLFAAAQPAVAVLHELRAAALRCVADDGCAA